jgi:hypothetical protein
MRQCIYFILISLFIVMHGASAASQSLIGKWVEPGQGEILHFKKGGKFLINNPTHQLKMSGTYEIKGNKELILNYEGVMTHTASYERVKEKLLITFPGKKTDVYQKVSDNYEPDPKKQKELAQKQLDEIELAKKLILKDPNIQQTECKDSKDYNALLMCLLTGPEESNKKK